MPPASPASIAQTESMYSSPQHTLSGMGAAEAENATPAVKLPASKLKINRGLCISGASDMAYALHEAPRDELLLVASKRLPAIQIKKRACNHNGKLHELALGYDECNV